MSEKLQTLRFGLLCDSLNFASWQVDCLDRLQALEGVSLELIVINAEPRTPPGWRTKLRTIREGLFLWGLYRRLAMRKPPTAYRSQDLSDRLSGTRQIRVVPERRGKFSQHFPPADLQSIRESGVDFMLRFGFGILRGEVLKTPKYGVWSFHHDDVDKYRGMPPGFWEIYNGDDINGAVLQRLTNRLDGGIILQRGFFKTIHGSYPQNISAVLMGSTDWPAKVCSDLLAGAADYLDDPPTPTSAPIVYRPKELQTLRFLLLNFRNRIGQLRRSLFRAEEWNVGLIDAPIESFLEREEIGNVEWLPTRGRRRFAADSFALRRDGTTTILLEDYDYKVRSGMISYCERNEDGGFGPIMPAMDLGVHMSYPYLFEHGGEIYCIPEIHRLRQVRLYRALDFPREWELVETLIDDFPALDATVFEHEGKWWMFCTDADRGALTKLHLFWASELAGPWRAHSGNPVKSDIRGARPAGAPFVHEGTLYRPAQDCSKTYGGAIVFNRVDRLTTTEFAEETVHALRPQSGGPFSAGLHTINRAGDGVVIDSKRHVMIREAFRHSLRNKLTKFSRKRRR